MKKLGLGLLVTVLLLAIALYINPQIAASHDTPYLNLQDESEAVAPLEDEVVQRVLLYGDAGEATTEQWQPSMARVAARASISPDKKVIVALGDNIYMRGYPQKDEGQSDWDEGQLESISYLDSQLKVAAESGAKMFLVPGNHDWYATEVQGQALHIEDYAKRHNVDVSFRPFKRGQDPLPESVDLPGVSLVFVDSEWLIENDDATTAPAYTKLDEELSRIRSEHPENLIITNQHHPMETMGIHGGYFSNFTYWFIFKLINIFYAMDQDVGHPIYNAYVAKIEAILEKYPRVIHASGREHSLQLFKSPVKKGADYNLVSGAGNGDTVTGAWHNENSRFALSQEGFMELVVTAKGVHISVYDIHQPEAVTGFWLDL